MEENLVDFLQSEYKQNKQQPVSIRLNGKEYIIPYPYVRDYKDYKKTFLTDFFDIMRRDYLAYQKHNLPVQYISWHDNDKHRKLIVPYDLRNKQVSPQEVANRIFKRAEKKYTKAISLSRYLAEAYPERPYQTLISIAHVRDMQKARYEHRLKLARDNAIYITKKVGNFLAHNAVKATNNIKNLDINKLKIKARRWALGVMLTTTITGAIYGAFELKEKQEQTTA